jgi:hypothetical protein
MNTLQQPDSLELLTHGIRDVVEAISHRPGETKEQASMRARAATHMILGLAPRGVIEVMLAGHAVMLHALMTDSVRRSLRGETDTKRTGTRAEILAINKAFHVNLDKLWERQAERAEQVGEVVELPLMEGDLDALAPADATADEPVAEVIADEPVPLAVPACVPSNEVVPVSSPQATSRPPLNRAQRRHPR